MDHADVEPAGKVHAVDSIDFSAQSLIGEMMEAPIFAGLPFFAGALKGFVVAVRMFHLLTFFLIV